MRLKYVKESFVTELRKAIPLNLARYDDDREWMDKHFAGRQYTAESKIEIDGLPELRAKLDSGKYAELENTIALHSALKGLTPSQAADERLWIWLAHGPYWEYMRDRWPVTGRPENKKLRYVLEHYFASDARKLVRHGLARLWWFGFATHQPKADDPYGLTKLLLHTSDARQSLMERQFWRNRQLLGALLGQVGVHLERGQDLYEPRERFRKLCKSFNQWGGTILLDSLDPKDVSRLVASFAQGEVPAGA